MCLNKYLSNFEQGTLVNPYFFLHFFERLINLTLTSSKLKICVIHVMQLVIKISHKNIKK
jgi:hypothetical protein